MASDNSGVWVRNRRHHKPLPRVEIDMPNFKFQDTRARFQQMVKMAATQAFMKLSVQRGVPVGGDDSFEWRCVLRAGREAKYSVYELLDIYRRHFHS